MSTRRPWRVRAAALAAALVVPGAAAAGPPAAVVVGARSPGPEVTCASCIVVADKGRVLWARSPDAQRANASTTKMVTALVVVEHAGLDEAVVTSPAAAATGGGGLDLQAGDVYGVEDLLYALLLSSSNDAAVALAEHVSGSHEAFVSAMNRRAHALGARDTRFVTAHGLDVPGHYSTARDLALLGRRLLDDPVLAGIVATARTTVTGPHGAVTLENRNPLLETYSGAVGIKTGYTAGAGNVLVAAARRDGRTLVAVAMGSADAAADAAALLDLGFARLDRRALIEAGDVVGALYWPAGGSTAVVAERTVRGPFAAASVELALSPTAASGVTAGDVVGRIVVRASGARVAVVDALAADSVSTHTDPWAGQALAWLLRASARGVGRL